MKAGRCYLAVLIALVLALTAFGQPGGKGDPDNRCKQVGGVLMTNIGAIDAKYNLGPVFGDLRGSVAAQILSANPDGTFTLQHYWVTDTGDSVYFAKAILHPTYPVGGSTVVAVPWGNYRSNITGGTGKFKDAHGYLDYFGMADFEKYTLVLRYSGKVCYAMTDKD